jgi:hypothetical protein
LNTLLQLATFKRESTAASVAAGSAITLMIRHPSTPAHSLQVMQGWLMQGGGAGGTFVVS